jgi:hypothetical protein
MISLEQALECVQQRVAHLLAFHGFSEPVYGISAELDRLQDAERNLHEAIEARDQEARKEVGPHYLACRACREGLGLEAE